MSENASGAEAIVHQTLHVGPDRRVQALLAIERLVDGGMGVRAAVDLVASVSGIGARTLFGYRKRTNFLPREQWSACLARPARRDRLGMQAECHPKALEAFIHMCSHGIEISEGYRRTVAEAEQKGWLPIPSERTLRRELLRHLDRSELRQARRNATV